MSGAGGSSVSDIIPFAQFAKFLEKVESGASAKDRLSTISRFFSHYRAKYKEIHNGSLNAEDVGNGDSIFSVVRLLLPNYDRKRAAYNIKATSYGRMFGKILGLSSDSSDGGKLIGFKDPGKAGNAAGDMAIIIYTILGKRFTQEGGPTIGPSLWELHKVLDQLAITKDPDANQVTQEKQIKILQGFVRKLSPMEGKWLTRIILKDIKLNVPHTQVLNAIHPQAKNLIKTMSLEQVCRKLNDPSVVISGSDGDIVLFNYFRPMLCARLNNLGDDAGEVDPDEEKSSPGKKSSRKKEEIALPMPPFVIETKWDGERFQIHYECDATTGECTFKYFSRKGFDFTTGFELSLTSRLKEQLVDDPVLESFIMDGEMMAWQKQRKMFTQKGADIDVKRILPENENHCPTFVAFDIVYYNGEVIVDKPLLERIEILRSIFRPKDSVIQLSEQNIVHSKRAVVDALNTAVDNLEEGLVVKSCNSIYEPGQRISNWLKIKPEYIAGSSVSDLDLLILGGYYTDSSRRGGQITHFMAGLLDKNEFYPLVQVGSGRLGKAEMAVLVSDLQHNFVKTEIPGVKWIGRKRPDFFIDPKKSIVVQVKATEITYSKEYELNYTLRFARITQIRRDKSWQDAMTVREFHDLRVSCEGKLAKRTDGLGRQNLYANNKYAGHGSLSDSDAEDESSNYHSNSKTKSSPKKPISPRRPLVLPVPKLSRKPTVKSNLFANQVFNVVGSVGWKEETESTLRSHGGSIVQNPTNDLLCVIAEKLSRRVQNIISVGSYDIVKISWMDKCIASNTFLPFLPDQMFFASKDTKEGFANDYDEFGDSFTTHSSLPQLTEQMKELIQQHIKSEAEPSRKEMVAIRKQVKEEVVQFDPKLAKWSFLSECKIAFRDEMDLILASQIQFYGGSVAESELESGVTHVLIQGGHSPQKKQHLSAFAVKKEWILDCLEKKQVLPELPYTLK